MSKSFYPPTTLIKASAIAKTIYKNGGMPIFRVTLAEEMGYKSESRTFRDLITASAGFGLTSGSYKSEKITLEERGRRLAQNDYKVAFEALLSIDIFREFYMTFGASGSKGIPSEKVAKDFLHNDQGIPETQTKTVLENIIQDARDWHIIQNIAGGDKFVPVELAKEKIKLTSLGTADHALENNQEESPAARDFPNTEGVKPALNISPNLQLNIQIHIAADTPDEKIETVFKNMKIYLLNNGKQ